MKKLLFILLIAFFCIACSSPEKKAKKLIEANLKETLHDWNSYESVKFGVLDSTFTDVYDDPEFVKIAVKVRHFNEGLVKAMEENERYDGMTSSWALAKRRETLNRATYHLDSSNYYSPIYDEMKENFASEFKGWSMQHSYRANNAAGNKSIGHFLFTFDKELTKVVNTQDISESSKN